MRSVPGNRLTVLVHWSHHGCHAVQNDVFHPVTAGRLAEAWPEIAIPVGHTHAKDSGVLTSRHPSRYVHHSRLA